MGPAYLIYMHADREGKALLAPHSLTHSLTLRFPITDRKKLFIEKTRTRNISSDPFLPSFLISFLFRALKTIMEKVPFSKPCVAFSSEDPGFKLNLN